jgi:iron complex outermembrane recepter protein
VRADLPGIDMDAQGLALWRNGGAALAVFLAASAPGMTEPKAGEYEVRPAGEPLEEIIVTARRREEPLLEVPVAVSVFSQPELERRRISELANLQYAAPSLVITTDQTNRATALIAMRGQFEPMSVPTLDPTVGVYLDGVYIARITGANLRLIDMERVEVLRGPQGTLFGRNTIGGAINLVTRAPSSELEGYVAAGAGNYNRRELTGVVNLPMAEGRHALRLVAAHWRHDGFGRSELLDRELNDDHTNFARAQLLLAPATGWELKLAVDYTRFENGGQLWTLLDTGPGADRVTAASGRPEDDIRNYVDPLSLRALANRAGSVDTRVEGASVTLTRFGPRWTFQSATAGRRLDSDAEQVDQDGTPYDLGAVIQRRDEQDQFSQEFQFSGHSPGERLDWMLGVHYFVERALHEQEFLFFNPLLEDWIVNLPDGSVRNDSIAAYAQLGYALSPRLRITAGLRALEDGRQLTSRNALRVEGVEICRLAESLRDAPDICRATLPTTRFRYTPYHLGLDFAPRPRALVYGKLSRGHRSGGYNFRAATETDLTPFGPERVTAWEAGARAEFLDGRLRVDLALFRSQFDDIQLIQTRFTEADAQINFFVQNGGEARIDGGELEVMARLGDLRLSGALGVVDARYTRLRPGVVQVTRDSKFLHTPKATAAAMADWAIHTGFGEVNLNVEYSWRDDVPFWYEPSSPARQPAYGLWNAGIQRRPAVSGICFGLWGRNLADKRYITRALNTGVFINAAPGDPRTWGANFRFPCRRAPHRRS